MIIMIFLLSFVFTTVAPDRSDKRSEIPDSFFKFNPTLVTRSLFSLSLPTSSYFFFSLSKTRLNVRNKSQATQPCPPPNSFALDEAINFENRMTGCKVTSKY